MPAPKDPRDFEPLFETILTIAKKAGSDWEGIKFPFNSKNAATNKRKRFLSFLKAWRNMRFVFLAEGGDRDSFPYLEEENLGRQLTTQILEENNKFILWILPRKADPRDQELYNIADQALSSLPAEIPLGEEKDFQEDTPLYDLSLPPSAQPRGTPLHDAIKHEFLTFSDFPTTLDLLIHLDKKRPTELIKALLQEG